MKELTLRLTKYEILTRYRIARGRDVYRIRALDNFTTAFGDEIKAGDLGGFVEDYSNLSQDGTAWIFDDSIVCLNATVHNNAVVKGNSMVWDYALIADHAVIKNESKVFGNAIIAGNAIIDDSSVFGNAIVAGKTHLSKKSKISKSTVLTGSVHNATDGRYGISKDPSELHFFDSEIEAYRWCFAAAGREIVSDRLSAVKKAGIEKVLIAERRAAGLDEPIEQKDLWRELRATYDLSVDELSKITGIPATSLVNWEHGRRKPRKIFMLQEVEAILSQR